MVEVILNVGDDPINPAYYAGTACAEIIEWMPTNVGFAAKYAWRLGEKDAAPQEAGKAIWYLERELRRCLEPDKVGHWFIVYSQERINSAVLTGKLDIYRSEIIAECVQYAAHGGRKHLERAIDIFRMYTDGQL